MNVFTVPIAANGVRMDVTAQIPTNAPRSLTGSDFASKRKEAACTMICPPWLARAQDQPMTWVRVNGAD
jgi:hypothetical protein